MLEHADGSEMCISEILKSLGVALASGKVAELFCRSRFDGAVVDMGFERRLVVDYVTGWMHDDVGQQRFCMRRSGESRRQGNNRLWQQGSKRPRSAQTRQ